MDTRKFWGKNSNEARATATVRPEKATVRPAVAVVRATAVSTSFPALQLLAEAADHEQSVVDRQTETEHRDDVDREDADIAEECADPEHGECSKDRDRAKGKWQTRGRHAAEDQDQQHKQDREGDRLGPGDVLLNLGIDIGRDGDHTTTQSRQIRRHEVIGNLLIGSLAILFGRPCQLQHRVGGFAVLGRRTPGCDR